MRLRDTYDVLISLLAALSDAAAIFGGFMLATWIRFHSGWIPLYHGHPSMFPYVVGAGVGTLLFLFIFQYLGLYKRPQDGSFFDKIPRLVRASTWSILLSVGLAFAIRTEPPFSRITVALSFFTILVLLMIERYILFRYEIHWAKHRTSRTRVMLVGTDATAMKLQHALENEPRLCSKVVGFLRAREQVEENNVPPEMMRGTLDDLDDLIKHHELDELVLVDTTLPHQRMIDIILKCERELISFFMVPDIFRVLTSDVEVRNISGIPMLGAGKWPLDHLWNRLLKRTEDIIGSLLGLFFSLPIILVAAIFIKRQSPGPVFYKQERCGEHGRPFYLYKLRTMVVAAEEKSGPVMSSPDDERRFPVGRLLRQFNLDELPQFWNVLKGDMTLVGPRPERPHFVEQFKEDISRYMWRHITKPGLTGWAQVNGLRGQTSISERIKYDLYYLENWSLSFDFKILIRTLFSWENAY